MTEPNKQTATHRDHSFVALMLITAGVLMLAGRTVPSLGAAVAPLLGLELIAWALLARSAGLVIAGGVVLGIGTGVFLAAGLLQGADPNVTGAAFLLCAAGGLALVALLSWRPLRQPQPWAWIVALPAAVIGTGLIRGVDTTATIVGWALPAVLIVAGVATLVRRARAR